MKYPIGMTLIGFFMVALLGLTTAHAIVQDDLGNSINAHGDGERVSIPFLEVSWQGKTKRSFGVREVDERLDRPDQPRLVVVSTHNLPISSHWACEVSGMLGTYEGVSRRDGLPVVQRVLIVQPKDIFIYCSSRGFPILFPPFKNFAIDWFNKRSIIDLERERLRRRGSMSGLLTMEEEQPLPPMPDSPYSPYSAVYCETIADAEAEYSSIARNLVRLDCRPFTDVTSTTFTLGQESPNPPDSITVYFSNSSNLPQGGRINTVCGAIQKDEQTGTYWIEVDSAGPLWEEGDDNGGVHAIDDLPSIVYARTLQQGEDVTLTGKVVSATQTEFPGAIYVQEPDRSAGIRVLYSGTSYQPNRGDLVSVEGIVELGDDGERQIDAGEDGVTYEDDGEAPRPLGMALKSMGGSDFDALTPGVSWPYGSGIGLHNKGLLITTWGEVTHVDAVGEAFWIEDGTGFDDGEGHTGVKVTWSWPEEGKPSIIPADEGWYVSVRGISGSQDFGSERIIRALRPRDQADIVLHNPSDAFGPTVAITTPSGSEITKATTATSVTITGTAMDLETKVVLVEVGITDTGSPTEPTTWNRASYDQVSEVWSYDWSSPASRKVWVRAKDFVGNWGSTSRNITVMNRTVKYVNGSSPNAADDANHGGSWDMPKLTVAAGLAATGSGELWVAQGTYSEHVTLKNGVHLCGGFVGTETYREQKNWTTNVTTLDGSGTGNVVTAPKGVATIDGFTIRNGARGIDCQIDAVMATSPVVENCTITDNHHSTQGAGFFLFCNDNGPYGVPTIRNCIIAGNTNGGTGGTIYCRNSSPSIINCTIVGNTSNSTYGAAIHCLTKSASAHVWNNIIAYNSSGIAKMGGSVYDFVLHNNCLYENSSYDYAGVAPGTGDITSDPRIVDWENGDYHLTMASPCINAGYDSAALPKYDLDNTPRTQGEHVDIGADEADVSHLYDLALTAYPASGLVDEELPVTAAVSGTSPLHGFTVHFAVTDGLLTEVNGVQLDPETTTYDGLTNESGEAYAKVTRSTSGTVTLTAIATRGPDGTPERNIELRFYSTIDDWPMFMHDPQHTGASLAWDDVTEEDLTLMWRADVPTDSTNRTHWGNHPNPPAGSTWIFPHPFIDSSPVQASGCPVIVGAWASGSYENTTTGYVVAYDPANYTDESEPPDPPDPRGIELWRYPDLTLQPPDDEIGGVASTPAVFADNDQKRVVFGSMDGKVYCLRVFAEGEERAGSLVWSYQTTSSGLENVNEVVEPARVLASPVVYNGRVYVGNESATVYCLNASTGAHIWSYTFRRDGNWPDRTGVSSVAIGPTADAEMRAYVGCDDGYVYCLSLEDSPQERKLWEYNAQACVESSPTIYNGNVYVGASWFGGTDLVALNAETGAYVWSRNLEHEVRATPAVSNGYLYVGEDTGYMFYRIDAATGDPLNDASFDASAYRPNPAGLSNYFVGSAALTSGGVCIVGNDNFALYALSASNLSLQTLRATDGIVCSSPAISYAAEPGYRWVYVVSRVGDGQLLAYRQSLN